MIAATTPAQPWFVLAVLAAEAAFGYPASVARYIPHPVVWIGRLITVLEARWNTEQRSERDRRHLGIACIAIVIAGPVAVGLVLQCVARVSPWTTVIAALLATTGLAQRSLYDHVRAVSRPLQAGDLPAARGAVGQIVGRDVATLDEPGVAAAALESLAESFNDGIVAPTFWFIVGGLPGLFAYKAVNTADSMIGHREPRWRAFGWAAARTDDAMNFIPARLAGALLAIAGRGGWKAMIRDARKHASPNAGWPEAAMAGALRIRFGGPAAYDGVLHDRPVFGEGAPPSPEDLGRGLALYVRACGVLWLLLAVGGFLCRP